MECCKNDLGLKPHNEDIDTGVAADQTGEFKAILTFGAARITKAFEVTIGENIIVPKPFNEVYQYNMTIIKPDGELLTANDCPFFSFKTFININQICNPCN